MKRTPHFRSILLAFLAFVLLLSNSIIILRYNLNHSEAIQFPALPGAPWQTPQATLDDVIGPQSAPPGRAAYARLPGTQPQVFAAHQRWVSSLTWAPNSRWFASASADASVNIWRPGETQQVHSLSVPDPVTAVACSPDGLLLAAATNTGLTYLWHTSDWSLAGKLVSPYAVTALAWAPDSQALATSTSTAFTQGNDVIIWNVAGGTEEGRLTAHTGAIRALAWSPDGELLASGGEDATIKVWNVRNLDGEQSSFLQANLAAGSQVNSLAWNPVRGTLFAGTGERQVLAWEPHRWLPVTLPTVQGEYAIAWSPDGTVLATAVAGEVHLWDAISRTEFARLSLNGSEVNTLAWSPDGRWLAAGMGSGAGQSPDENTIKLWPVS